MTEKEKVAKIKEIRDKFLAKIKNLEKRRDEQVKIIKKEIDQRRIDQLSQDLRK